MGWCDVNWLLNEKARGHPGLNQGPLDLQSNALPLSYIPMFYAASENREYHPFISPRRLSIQNRPIFKLARICI